MFADDVLEALVRSVEHPDFLSDAMDVKKVALQDSVARGNQPDDLKRVAGDIFNGLRGIRSLPPNLNLGSNLETFMRFKLAPLIAPGMPTYEAMKSAIIDKIP